MSGKKDKHPPQDLSALENSYRIVGELSARDNVREYLATRVEDGADLRILVEEAPRDDAGNALTLYAADVNLLAGLEHRNLIPIRDGRWVAQDRFAVVTDRCQAPTLETLISRGDSWSYPRIGRILSEVNGLLEWARDQKVVHRALTLGTVHIEPDTDRVLASFIAQPLTRKGAPGAEGDARTIAQLAWTLITRGRDLPQSTEDSIGIVRPELPRRVVEAVDALLHGQRVGSTEPPTVPDFIGIVAATDAIMQGEVIAAEVEATIHQEHLLEQEAWAAKERDYQEQLAEQERRMEEERQQMAQTLTSERQTMEDTLTSERQELSDTLATERERMAGERAELEKQMADERQRMADAHAELERQIADERERMADAQAELERQVADERTRMAEEREALVRELGEERADLEREVAAERQQLAEHRAEFERHAAEERERLERDRTEHEAELAKERAAMAATIADERAQLEQRIAEERAQLEQRMADERAQLEQRTAEERAQLEATLSEGQRRLLEERTAAETALATARAEFEAQMTAQREEFDAKLASEREAFERAMIAERNALEADKEGFAVFNSAEREAIESERRALEELYLAYEADGHVVVDAEEEARTSTDDAAPDVQITRVTAALADYAPISVAAPVSEPAPDSEEPMEPAETEAGLTRDTAKRSRRAAWGIPASVILLVGIVTATAVGVGAGSDDSRDPAPQREERPAAEQAQPTQLAAPAAPTVIDSAGGTVVTPDSTITRGPDEAPSPVASRDRGGTSPPARPTRPRPRPVSREAVSRPGPPPVRSFDTAATAPVQTDPAVQTTLPPANPVSTPPAAQTFPPTIMPTATPTVTPTAPRDTAPATPLPTVPPATIPQPTFPTIPPTS